MSLPNQLIKFRLMMGVFLVLAGCFLLPTAQAQEEQEEQEQKQPQDNRTSSYFLDNFKCAVDMGCPLSFDSIDNSWYSRLQPGLSFGYYILKYNHTQQGVVRNKEIGTYRHVCIHTGKGLVSMEVGMRYPERHFLKDRDTMQIEERLITIPITIQWTRPDYFAGCYYTFFLGYAAKRLLASACILPQSETSPVPIATKDVNKFFHSVVVGSSWLLPFGMYLQIGFDVPIRPYNDLAAYDVQSTSVPAGRLEKSRCLLCLGIDITMLIRACYGMSFKDPNPKITDL